MYEFYDVFLFQTKNKSNNVILKIQKNICIKLDFQTEQTSIDKYE